MLTNLFGGVKKQHRAGHRGEGGDGASGDDRVVQSSSRFSDLSSQLTRRQSALAIVLVACGALGQELAPQKSNTTENLRGVSVLAEGIAWASGAHGTYLRTLDGGSTWHAAQVPGGEGLDFRDVKAFSADMAYLLSAGLGDQSRIYKTTDAGRTWTLQFTNRDAKGFFDCMAFWDRDHGIAVGDPVADAAGNLNFELISTADGGKEWKALRPSGLPRAVEGEGAFAASGTCIAVQGKKNVWFVSGGTTARVFRSSNGGKSWTVAETPMAHGPASAGIFSIAFRDGKHGVMVGGDYQHPERDGRNVAFSGDGGRTWKLAGASPQAYFSAVALRPTRRGVRPAGTAVLVVGSAGAAYSDDITRAGWRNTWKVNLNALSVGAKGEAIAVGPQGAIASFSHLP